MDSLAHSYLAYPVDNSFSDNLPADFVRDNPETHYLPDAVTGTLMHRCIDVMTDNLLQMREARERFRSEACHVAPITLNVMWDHFLSCHWSEISSDLPLTGSVRYARTQATIILPEPPPRSTGLNNYIRSEKWLEYYRGMGLT